MDILTTEEEKQQKATMSSLRRWLLLVLFCIAQFLETYNSSAIFVALPSVINELKMNAEENPWLIAAYQLTFASLLLVSGRISDVYNPKTVFLFGNTVFGILSLACGFIRNSIGLLIFRAVTGMGASLTIPSALHLIVRHFPEKNEQARAVTVFGAMAALGNVLGLIFGALLLDLGTWRWVFWIGGIVGLPVSVCCAIAIPNDTSHRPKGAKRGSIDLVGVTTITSALILLIFAVTSGSTYGWGTATFIAPLIISLFLIVGFSYGNVPPPRMWRYPNFVILTVAAIVPFFWFSSTFYQLTSYWQETLHWSPLSAAVHFLPLGLVVIFVIPLTSNLPNIISPKLIIIAGYILMAIGTILLTFGNGGDRYWSICFPAFIIGPIGVTLVFSCTNIVIFRSAPAEEAGTVGAIFNSSLQLGTAIGVPIISAIQSNIQNHSGAADNDFKGQQFAFWFLLGLEGVEILATLVFYRTSKSLPVQEGGDALVQAPVEEEVPLAVTSTRQSQSSK
ncbi:hypothetical protein SERLA73DRAFT_156771 [Serpula lacrymans var. lacrymans S7.3]|uniref:Major facilitator superfamily (MFS) profile domain-containing protein n=1 Tax=Serpula lacrymans var. lacrymans (strain S7.3) TaxID=936435 RepID=F8QFU5_SERL3|nr:hypothetical protein SERLA73DRAFT_156771 [Serpula lacrymans var. lacrymans S7.3]